MRGIVRLALAFLLALAGVLGLPGRADAAGGFFACVDAGNVWLVVNYQGAISQGCAVAPATGLAALRQVTSVRMSSSGMVAQIGGNPAALDPDPNVYWNYFHKDKAGDGWGAWVYSSLGAGSYQPRPGSVEGWTYGRTGASMGWSPPTRPAPTTAAPVTTQPAAPTGPAAPATTTVATTRAATTRPTQAATTKQASDPASAAVSAEPSATPTDPATSVVSPTVTTESTPSAAADPGSAVPSASTGPEAMRPVDRGTPAATVATLVVIALAGAGGGGWWLLRRRRTTS